MKNQEVEVIKSKENVLIKTPNGEYHFSKEEYRKLGKQKAIEFAEKEIAKKNSSGQYSQVTINFDQARELGFCEYGIKDFCNQLNLDIKATYTLEELNKKLTLDVLKEYPDELLKLFGKNCIKYLGTVKELISPDTLQLFLREEFIDARTLHQIAVKCAYRALPAFEKEYPNDNRARNAIETKERWIEEKIRIGELWWALMKN